MKKIQLLLSLIIAFSQNSAADKNNVKIKQSLVSRAELVIDSQDIIHGIQFDILYNPLEIKSVTALQIYGYEVKYKQVSDTLIRGQIFSLQEKAMPKSIKFDFINTDGFTGISIVQFQDIILATIEADVIQLENQLYEISFSNISLSSKNELKDAPLKRNDIYDNSWAVIIGIDKYQYSDQLKYAVNDAKAIKDMLISKFDFPMYNINYLVNEEATLSGIKLALDDVATSAGINDRVLVFYSGHGETVKGFDGTEKGYIIPYEGKQNKAYVTGLAMDEILTISMLSKSKHMLFLMDACYSGLMTENVKGLANPIEDGYLLKVSNESARQIITAGGSKQQVIERDKWQHSAFTKNLLRGLNDWEADTDRDGYVTADELGTYLSKSVTKDSESQQTPQKGRFERSGRGEFLFINDNTNIIPKRK